MIYIEIYKIKKAECYNKRSANFIVEGALSIEITQVKRK